ncbi:hypothetical protein CRG98_025674 [Punica granatum]|uniref:Uncharacterized protein n=1 Tax=Punica granatum TaxID=22663 RepID=A0A2I0JD81_PUNGR|nr:hypothetical protein CRG98_025674 [Punica granatum]
MGPCDPLLSFWDHQLEWANPRRSMNPHRELSYGADEKSILNSRGNDRTRRVSLSTGTQADINSCGVGPHVGLGPVGLCREAQRSSRLMIFEPPPPSLHDGNSGGKYREARPPAEYVK